MKSQSKHGIRTTRFRQITLIGVTLLLCAGGATSCLTTDPTTTTVPASTMPARTEITYFVGDAHQPEALRMELWVPNPAPTGPMPVLVYLHGGGFYAGTRTSIGAPTDYTIQTIGHASYPGYNGKMGDQTTEHPGNRWDGIRDGQAFMSKLNDGWAVASIDYGLSTQANDVGHVTLKDQVTNTKRAIRYLRTNASFLNLNPDKVVVAGGSAGGTISTIVGLTPGQFEPVPAEPTVVQGAVNFDGPVNLRGFQDCATGAAASGCTASQPGPTTGMPYDIRQRFGTTMSFADYLPAASNCPTGQFTTPGCTNLVNTMIDELSPYSIVAKQSSINSSSIAPLYILCSVEGIAGRSCANDQLPFHDLLASKLTPMETVVLNATTHANHFTLDRGVNYTTLNSFLNNVVGN